jgi:hypothetical protein
MALNLNDELDEIPAIDVEVSIDAVIRLGLPSRISLSTLQEVREDGSRLVSHWLTLGQPMSAFHPLQTLSVCRYPT